LASPYVRYEDMVHEQEKEKRKKWIIKDGFNNVVGKATSKKVPLRNYVMNLDHYDKSPTLHYKYRMENKSKWITGSESKPF
jgi:hypothetical protein